LKSHTGYRKLLFKAIMAKKLPKCDEQLEPAAAQKTQKSINPQEPMVRYT
jgi:hypothetical protein